MLKSKFLGALAGVLIVSTVLGLLAGLLAILPFLFGLKGYNVLKRWSLDAFSYVSLRRKLILHRIAAVGLFLLFPVIALIHAGRGVFAGVRKGMPSEWRCLADVWRGHYA